MVLPSLRWEQRRKGRLGGHAELNRGPVESEPPRNMEGRRQLEAETWFAGQEEHWSKVRSGHHQPSALRVAVQNWAEPTLVLGASLPRDGGRGCPRSRHPQA